MRKLTISTGTFDQINTFTVNVDRGVPARCSLHCGYLTEDDGIYWAMMRSACLKSKYTAADIAERERLNSETPLKNGDYVEIDGNVYTVRVLGAHSDCVIFDKV